MTLTSFFVVTEDSKYFCYIYTVFAQLCSQSFEFTAWFFGVFCFQDY